MLKLLIVDDDPGLREGLALGLSDSFEVGQASGGKEALLQMETERPDVVLLDQNMEGLSGTHVLENLGSQCGAPAVVMFSATMDISLVRRALKLGALDCVAKPFSLDELRGKLQSAAKSRIYPNGDARPFQIRVIDLLKIESKDPSGNDLDRRRREFVRQLMNEALLDTEGDLERAAQRLGMEPDEFTATHNNLKRGELQHGRQLPIAG
jgi:DNA-binding NtrC family response regulator